MTTPGGSRLILPTLLCPGPDYYRAMLLHDGPVVIDTATPFDKNQKAAHRCRIADVRGPVELTVPIAKPYGHTWGSTRISLHGRWWEVMKTTLESAYGRTPYFEFIADEFLEIIADPDSFTTVADLNRRFDIAIRHCLDIRKEVSYEPLGEATIKKIPEFEPAPYWQVRADKLGFISGLSVIDLIFNLGPEAILTLIVNKS